MPRPAEARWGDTTRVIKERLRRDREETGRLIGDVEEWLEERAEAERDDE